MKSRGTAGLASLVAGCVLLTANPAVGQEYKTVIGPTNIDLHEGAELLKSGAAEEGLRRTLAGLEYAVSPRDKVAGMSNACAGYLMLDKPEDALPWCDQALAIQDEHWRALTNRALAYIKLGRFEDSEADISLAEQLAPNARSVKLVRSLLLDATDPVTPHIVVDDRRQPADDAQE